MGWADNLSKIAGVGAVVGSTVSDMVRGVKPTVVCNYCGKRFNEGGGVCSSHFFSFSWKNKNPNLRDGAKIFCSDCMKTCKTCKKMFCLKHFEKHEGKCNVQNFKNP